MARPNQDVRWIGTRRIMLAVLGLWGLFSFAVHLSIGVLNKITVPVLGFPLGFYMAAQGSLILFVILLFLFAKSQDQMDRDHGFAADGDRRRIERKRLSRPENAPAFVGPLSLSSASGPQLPRDEGP